MCDIYNTKDSLLTRFIPQTLLFSIVINIIMCYIYNIKDLFLHVSFHKLSCVYVYDIRNTTDSLLTRFVPQTLLFNIMISTCVIFATATSCESRPRFGLSSARFFHNSVVRTRCHCSSLYSAQKRMWRMVGFQMFGRNDIHRHIM